MMEKEIFVVNHGEDGELHFEPSPQGDYPLMQCGHTAQATTTLPPDEDGTERTIRCCVICAGIDKGYNICADKPSLKGRKARCDYWRSKDKHQPGDEVDSKWSLAFFEYRPDKEYDKYYCGCFGWN
jgi:hypothetical protein